MIHSIRSFQISKLALCLSFLSASLTAFAAPQLTDEEMQAVREGSQVQKFVDIKGNWPEGNIYQKLNLSPKEAAAVFFDFEHHAEMMGGYVKSSRVSKTFPDKKVLEATYQVTPPVIGTDYVTFQENLTHDQAKDSYKISWLMLSSKHLEKSDGEIVFESLDGNATLMTYTAVVSPKSGIQKKLFKNKCKATMVEGSVNIANRMEYLRTQNPELLKQEVANLEAALAN